MEPDGSDFTPIESNATELRRTVPRLPVDWTARYRLHGDPMGHWRPCRITDISSAGAGLRLFGVTPDVVEGRKIEVSVQLCGEVRHAGPGTDNDVRVGIAFVDLGDEVETFVDALKRSSRRW